MRHGYMIKGNAGTTLLDAAIAMTECRCWRATLPSGKRVDYGPAVRRWERITGTRAPWPVVTDDLRLRPELPEWMMGYTAGYITDLPITRAAMLERIGLAVQPQAAIAAIAELKARIEQGETNE